VWLCEKKNFGKEHKGHEDAEQKKTQLFHFIQLFTNRAQKTRDKKIQKLLFATILHAMELTG
jgi:hypothetical protein